MDIELNNGCIARNVTPMELKQLEQLGYIGKTYTTNSTGDSIHEIRDCGHRRNDSGLH